MAEGWFCLHRGWRGNSLFHGKYSRSDAWIWLIENACWQATLHDIKGTSVTLERGQLCASRDRLASVWGWSQSAVERFLARLQTEQMIGRETGQGKSVITICNYAKYQDFPEKSGRNCEQSTRSQTGLQKNKVTRKQDFSVANATGTLVPSNPHPVADIIKVVFDTGVTILTSSGLPQAQSRSIIGHWRKTYSDGVVLTVLSRCELERPSAPVEWITAALRAEVKRASQGQSAASHLARRQQLLPVAHDFGPAGIADL